MDGLNLVRDTVYAVTVFSGEDVLVGITIVRTGATQVDVSIFHDDDDDVVTASFILHIALQQLANQINIDRAKQLTREAIDAIKENYASEGEESPSPADVSDIPF